MDAASRRRKIRKGTRSCWECKRRKVRCTLSSEADAICINCRRRGTRCQGQEFSQDTSSSLDIGGRMGRVESLLDRLLKEGRSERVVASCGGSSPSRSRSPTQRTANVTIPSYGSDDDTEPPVLVSLYEPSAEEPSLEGDDYVGSQPPSDALKSPIRPEPSVPPIFEKLSLRLHAVLPYQKDLSILWNAGIHTCIYFHQVMSRTHGAIQENGLRAECDGVSWEIDPTAHPVLVAKHLFRIATVLQYLDPESNERIKDLSVPPREMMKKLADAAISLVTTNDELLGTVEALQAIVAEGIYHANCGNLRRAWIVFRRAMTVAQLMGMHRAAPHPLKVIDPCTQFDAKHLWNRIVYTDRHLCLMLGLPPGSFDRSMGSKAALADDTPLGQLERLHSVIALRILERNDADPGACDVSVTLEIDLDLQTAARTMPSGWWLAPNLAPNLAAAVAGRAGEREEMVVFSDMLKLVNQLYHYNLLNQLHLPFMLRFDSDATGPPGPDRTYSLTACANASREVLSRFTAFRGFNRVAFCCRAVDFFALLAALTLLLAHLDNHHRQRRANSNRGGDGATCGAWSAVNFLAHQHVGDRALMEQVRECMDEVARVSDDALSAKSAGLLRRLLAIEAEAASGQVWSTQHLRTPEEELPSRQYEKGDRGNESSVLRIRIPYFGTIRIAREGVISKEETLPDAVGVRPKTKVQRGNPPVDAASRGFDASTGAPTTCALALHEDSLPTQQCVASQLPGDISSTNKDIEVNDVLAGEGMWNCGPQPVSGPTGDATQQYDLYPGTVAGVEDWAFQGVDTAFFDSLMRGSAGGSSDWGWNVPS